MRKGRTATSDDVARQAGVSRATVSVVLNGTRGNIRVSEATRQRVLSAASELEYTPHPSARALRRQRSGVIGFVPRSFRRTPYDHPVPYLLGIRVAQAAARRGFHVVEASAETEASRGSDEMARFLLSRRVDGVVFDCPDTAEEVRRFLDRGVPVIQLIRPQREAVTPTITVDPSLGVSAALDHLVALGHSRIAFIGHGGEHPADRSRLDCFLAALARLGVGVRPDWLRLVADYGIEEGCAAGRALLTCAERPTALFVTGDNLALGVLQALYQAEVRIPDDLSLITYDDIFAAYLPPPLTSVAQPLEEVAERAIALMTERVDTVGDAGKEPTDVALPTHLTVRGSTQPPRQSGEGKEGNPT